MTRRPYSFLGDAKRGGHLRDFPGATWHDGLVDYTDGTEAGARRAEAGLSALGERAGINFRFDVRTQWQPVDSQRLLLWAGRVGKQEQFMDALNHRHFQEAKSASEKETLLAAAAAVGLDAAAAAAFLATDEHKDDVWKSYGDTIRKYDIHAIPLFVFHHPASGAAGGPFRPLGSRRDAWVVNGSGDANMFLALLSEIRDHALRASSSSSSSAPSERAGSKSEL